jgi:hypothetical protein
MATSSETQKGESDTLAKHLEGDIGHDFETVDLSPLRFWIVIALAILVPMLLVFVL